MGSNASSSWTAAFRASKDVKVPGGGRRGRNVQEVGQNRSPARRAARIRVFVHQLSDASLVVRVLVDAARPRVGKRVGGPRVCLAVLSERVEADSAGLQLASGILLRTAVIPYRGDSHLESETFCP